MAKQFVLFTTVALTLITSLANAGADWPKRVFAPYMYVGAGDHFKLTDCDNRCGLKFYTLAFIISDKSNNPAWDGRIPMPENFYRNQIEAIRARGGDVIISFGGEAGNEIAIVETNVTSLEAKYQSIVDRYHFTWLDFDIEGKNLENIKANERRNTALAALQKKNPGLIISYTLPVDPTGISDDSQKLLSDAKAKGLKVRSANIMVMFFGKKFVGKGKSEGQLGVDSANAAYSQLQKIDPAIQVGLCPCLGRNGSNNEVFTLNDAKILKVFADKTPWVCSLHYWSINDDAVRPRKNQSAATNNAAVSDMPQPWAFARIFQTFTAR